MADARPDDLDRLLGEATNPGPCPDENALSALSEGRLAAGERDAVLAHVAACRACSWVTGGLLEAAPAPVATPRRAPLLRILPWAAAAAVLVAAGAWWFTREPSPEPLEHADTERFLADASAQLAREVPDRFRDFTPLSPAELASPPADPPRGSPSVMLPTGRIMDVRPELMWLNAFGATSYELTLLGRTGEIWRRRVVRKPMDSPFTAWPADAPPLAPGESYVWTMTADDPHGTRAERAFTVATDEEMAAWRAAVADIEARFATPRRHLLVAHLALRREFLTEAFLAYSRYQAARPDIPVDPELVAYMAARLAR